MDKRSTGHWFYVVIPFPQGAGVADGSAQAGYDDRYLCDIAIESPERPNRWAQLFPQHTWEFNDDMERPTLSPSIWHNKPFGWHGYVDNGQLRDV